MALVVFAKLLELGLPDINPVAFDEEGRVVAPPTCVTLLLLEDEPYSDNDTLQNYDLGTLVMVIRHSQNNQSQLDLVNRYLAADRTTIAVPISQRLSHVATDDVFVNLKEIVSFQSAEERQLSLRRLVSRFTVDHYTQLMDEYAALKFLHDLSPTDTLEIQAKKVREQIPETWRPAGSTVEDWYANMIRTPSFASA